jgi:hypothetical protein
MVAVPSARRFVFLRLVFAFSPKHLSEDITKPTFPFLLLCSLGGTFWCRPKRTLCVRSWLNNTLTYYLIDLLWPRWGPGRLALLKNLSLHLFINWMRSQGSWLQQNVCWMLFGLCWWCLRSCIQLVEFVRWLARTLQQTRLCEFFFFLLIQWRILHNRNGPANLEVPFSDSLRLPAGALQIALPAHVCGHEPLSCEHVVRSGCFKRICSCDGCWTQNSCSNVMQIRLRSRSWCRVGPGELNTPISHHRSTKSDGHRIMPREPNKIQGCGTHSSRLLVRSSVQVRQRRGSISMVR